MATDLRVVHARGNGDSTDRFSQCATKCARDHFPLQIVTTPRLTAENNSKLFVMERNWRCRIGFLCTALASREQG